jgi:YhgE/Pip-like protein
MSAMRVLVSPRVLIPLVAVTAVLALIFFAYLYPVVSPEVNLKNLPIALVNEDRGAELAGERVELGDLVVEKVTDPDSPAADTVEWAKLGGRDEAMEGIGNDEYYGALVIPAGYSERISSLITPPTIPIAVVNEDEGAVMNGQPMRLGEEVEKRITAPDTPVPPFVQWTRTDDRATALEGLEEGDFYAAIVLPEDYSRRLASMSGPPAGAPPSGAPTGRPTTPEPAEIELVTSPAVRPSATALIEDAFSGIVGGVSQATSERILGSLSEQGVSVPPGAGALIADPVKGKVSESDISAEVGPLPEAPEPAEIEVLTNPSAGQGASLPAQNISTGIVEAVSRATSERLSEAAGERGARLTPEVAAVFGDPVRAEVTEAQPVGPDSGNGQSPFFLAFLANLSALIGGAVVFFATEGVAKELGARGLGPSRTGLWTVRLALGFVYAALVAGVELWVAFSLVGVEHETSTTQVYLFLAFAIAAILTVTLLLAAAMGPAGIGVSAILGVILGLVSSGGLAPLEALPPFYQAYADWLPLRYVIDGLRSLLFYDGSLGAARLEGGLRDAWWFLGSDGRSEAAGLEDAVWMIGAYLAGSVILGYVISVLAEFVAWRRKPQTEPGKEPAAAVS